MKFKLILCMLFLGISSKFTFCQEKKILPFYCQFKISDELVQSNTSFTDGFIFKIGKDSKPFEIGRGLGNTLDIEEAKECLSNWKFLGFKQNTRGYIYFSWKHGVGWTRIRVSSKGFSQNYRVEKSKYIKTN